jgi:hypothetical protein
MNFRDLTPAQRRKIARRGAYAAHAKHGTVHMVANAHAALAHKFEQEVDPDGHLDRTERQRRARQARSAYMQTLALRSIRARRRGSR